MQTESAVYLRLLKTSVKSSLFNACGHEIRAGNLFQSIGSFLLNVKCQELIIIMILDYVGPNLLYYVHTETWAPLLNCIYPFFLLLISGQGHRCAGPFYPLPTPGKENPKQITHLFIHEVVLLYFILLYLK